MNQRIQQLEKQASDYYWSLDDGVRTADAFTQKFAELIVQECVNVLHDNELWSRDVSHVLKEHFGVEE
jgi:hypothetical protein